MVRTAHGNVRSVEEASVAGESPDRSKQRESSAEPTSGSADSVPEAPDPRLAVAAGKETAGGVDTATRVFSVRDLKTADETGETGEDDTKLRDAVAAWVRTGEPAEDAAASAEDATDPEAPEAATEAEEGPETPEERQEAPEAPENADKTATAPEATTTPEPADTDPGDEPKAPAEPEDAAPQGESATTAAPEDAKPTTTAAPEPQDATPQDKPKAADEPEDAKPGTKPKATGEPEDAKPEAAAEPEDAKPGTKPQATGEPEDAKPEAAAEPQDAKPGTKPQATDEPEDAKPEAAAEPEDAKPGTKPQATGEPEDAKPEAAAEPEDAKPGTEPQATGEPEDAVPGGKSEGAGEIQGVKSGSVGGGSGSGDGGADADGEEGPQGPPAADDDGRTGGAGGKTGGAEGEAEAEPAAEAQPAAAVDQPTTMLKAPRPPQVDQPTTMLKLGDAKPKPKPKPKTPDAEADAERTSRFVALKSDIKQDPKPEPASTTRTTVLPQIGPERTTQQPLPPKPPLDLLAELTNTPPPPETPVRTLFRRVKIWTPLVIVALIIFAVVQTLRPLPQPTLGLTAKDTYTFDGSAVDIPWPADGQAALDVQGIGTFGSSGDQKPVPIASVAKVMTAYIILRDHPLKSGAAGPKIGIDQAAQDQANAGQESTVDVTAGDSITQREALESILIASANNVARLLARWDAGSEKAFVAKMNATAKKLGMTNTTYTDPSGLTDSTVSTAVDQVKLAKTAMASEPSFREVAAMMSYDDYKGVNHSNWNQLVGHNDVVGIKTGTTTSALGNLVFAAKKTVGGETRTIIGAVLRQPASAASDNSILTAALNGGDKLIRAAQAALKPAKIFVKGEVVGYVDDGLGGLTPVVATQDVTAVGWSKLKVKVSFQAEAGGVPHSAKAGTKVGTLTVGDGSGSAVRVPVALSKDLVEPGFTSKLTRLG
ncbi:D-alanyl-D-alanine carboxypeptidase [Streptomyces hyaluromycini]|uniref:D-alanyl-D-alanine carboxypeptidase n=1 Tax=Streptomyces hyaluromycini TaxID=1377993 RepID=UPI001237C3DF|nr:D-alanyl-D-alanine carboxypeptidase [Streptomyces hyaluromycini]